jgi:hypothetical protein
MIDKEGYTAYLRQDSDGSKECGRRGGGCGYFFLGGGECVAGVACVTAGARARQHQSARSCAKRLRHRNMQKRAWRNIFFSFSFSFSFERGRLPASFAGTRAGIFSDMTAHATATRAACTPNNTVTLKCCRTTPAMLTVVSFSPFACQRLEF